MTLVSGSAELFQKFENGYPDREHEMRKDKRNLRLFTNNLLYLEIV